MNSWRAGASAFGNRIQHRTAGNARRGDHSFLLKQRSPTFITRDEGFYEYRLCHARYSLVYLAVEKCEAALFVRRLLRHSEFKTQSKRMGKVVRASSAGISLWHLHAEREIHISWELKNRSHR